MQAQKRNTEGKECDCDCDLVWWTVNVNTSVNIEYLLGSQAEDRQEVLGDQVGQVS